MRLPIAHTAARALAAVPRAEAAADTTARLAALEDAKEGRDAGTVGVSTSRYTDDADWTNAFGDLVVGLNRLVALQTEILSLNSVRAGRTDYVFNGVC